jgi:ubiquinone/menaquinone biosynthesis C-methylase UbiE
MNEYNTKQELRKFFEDDNEWRFAKSMPQIPHWYIVKQKVKDQFMFEAAVMAIRKYGYEVTFKGQEYIYLNINQYHYWTMGAPLDETIIINRAFTRPNNQYDGIAEKYEDLFTREEYRGEDVLLMDALHYTHGTVLDIGCGTGLFLDYHDMCRGAYVGVDPSFEMLKVLNKKYEGHQLLHTTFEDLVCETFDNVIGLFSGSYLKDPVQALKHWNKVGVFCLVFYKEGYTPVTHTKFDIKEPATYYTREQLEQMFNTEIMELTNYYIVKL